VGKTQINSVIKNKAEILKQWESGANGDRKIVTARRCLYPALNDKVYEWFCVARGKNIPLTGKMIQEKAILIAVELNLDDFTASNGWLNRFQARYNIKCSVLSGESADVNPEIIEDWSKRLSSICKNYDPADIFNCDETVLFYRALPTRSLVEKGDTCNGGKKSKDRITVLLCASGTGEKIKPLVIGKSQNPRSFKGYHKSNFRVTYEANKKAWMTGKIFETWLKRLNHKMRMQDRKILLFIDNCSSHPHLDFSNIKLAFFPPNTTSKLQPMDAGIIQNFKLIYRKKLLRHVLFLMDDVSTATEVSKCVTLLDAIQWLTSAWDKISEETIEKCFKKCGFFSEINGKFNKI